MNAEWLHITLDKRLWELFLEIIRMIAEILDLDAEDLLKRILINPEAEQLLSQIIGNGLKAAV